MILYVGLLVLLLGSVFAPKNNKTLFFISCFVLFAVAALQHPLLGKDSGMYLRSFQSLKIGGTTPISEPLWKWVATCIGKVGGNYIVFQVIYYLLVLSPVFYVIYKKSTHFQLTLFLFYAFFYYLNSYCILRQSLAVTLIIVFYYVLFEKKYILASIFYILAVLTHTSAAIAILPVAFLFIHFSKKQIIYILIAAFIVGILLPIEKFSFFLGPYKKLLTHPKWGLRPDTYVYTAVIGVLNAIFIFFMIPDTEENQKSANCNILFLGFLFMNLTQQLVLGLRITQYFMIAQIFYYTTNIEAKQENKIKWLIALLVFSSIYFFGLLYRDSIGIIPYKPLEWIQNLF
jgi:hypothetical protein